jgi:uncharacterized protein (DUF362 family)
MTLPLPVAEVAERRQAGERLVEIETAVSPGFVVMGGVLREHGLNMSLLVAK